MHPTARKVLKSTAPLLLCLLGHSYFIVRRSQHRTLHNAAVATSTGRCGSHAAAGAPRAAAAALPSQTVADPASSNLSQSSNQGSTSIWQKKKVWCRGGCVLLVSTRGFCTYVLPVAPGLNTSDTLSNNCTRREELSDVFPSAADRSRTYYLVRGIYVGI